VTRPPRTTRLSAIDDATASEIRALLALAEDADGVEAVSESFRLAIGPAREGVVHLVRLDEDDAVVGYAQVAQAGGPDAVAELVVDPRHRRRGHGRALLDEVVALGARSVWAHGMLPAATALAAAAGLVVTRELYVMSRPLTAEDAVDPVLPQGFSVETFADRGDVEELRALNAAAFANHPEQGRLTRSDLEERIASEWFDANGLFYLLDENAPMDDPPVAFHWTKVEPTTPPAVPRGEVYVVGVDPAYQGRGLGGPVTSLGLAHLARLGLAEVELYVDGDNTAARRTYTRLGFRDTAVHAQYGTQPGTPSADAPSADLTEPDRIAP
jgi:mycothiol synthase